ncbi:hypothetical protein [Trichocoleus sp. FACHB-40]|uniref:hypothetical protein n=1 Tax=Trichocoleus sp. FACHB-40 TaxID=2692870 RepID=UPI001687B26F|nr:hypothetical protein [Trichocoleus sp. FACHB-40]MBD2002117.1 hypothetical protein [Trichocoleus sp. FACHB-40]
MRPLSWNDAPGIDASDGISFQADNRAGWQELSLKDEGGSALSSSASESVDPSSDFIDPIPYD